MRFSCYESATDKNLFFDQSAPTTMPHDEACPESVYKPSDSLSGYDWPFEGIPGSPHTNDFDNLNGENANGTWRLARRGRALERLPAAHRSSAR